MDRVQVLKRETAAGGGDAADEQPWPEPIAPQEDAIEAAGLYVQDASHRDEAVGVFRDGDDLILKDASNPSGLDLTTLAAGAGGVTEDGHKVLRQLIHFLDDGPGEGFSGPLTKTVTGGLFPTLIEWRDSASKLVVDKQITRSGGGATLVAPTPIVWRVYDTDGSTVLATVTDAITYSGVTETSRTRTIT